MQRLREWLRVPAIVEGDIEKIIAHANTIMEKGKDVGMILREGDRSAISEEQWDALRAWVLLARTSKILGPPEMGPYVEVSGPVNL